MGLDWEGGRWEVKDEIDDEENEALTVWKVVLLDGVINCLRYPRLLLDREDCSLSLS